MSGVIAPSPGQSKVQIFGREPAFWIGVIEAVLAVVLSWNAFGLTIDVIAGIMAVVTAATGVYVAYVTRDTMLGVLVGLTKSIVICLAAFQVHLTESQTTSVIALVALLGSLFNRSQTAPTLVPSFRDPSLPAEEIPVPVDPTPSAGGHAYRGDSPAEYGAGELRLVGLVVVGVVIALILWAILTRVL